MGFLDAIGLGRKRLDALTSLSTSVAGLAWQDDAGIGRQVALDIIGDAPWPLTRLGAMQIPAVARARNLIVAAATQAPLLALSLAGPLAQQPAWLQRTDTRETPQGRISCTVDDGLFYGQSLWVVERGAAGQITRAGWVPTDRWTVTNGAILVDEQPVDESEVLYFDWPGWDGLLAFGSRTLKGARALEESWISRAKNPIPLLALSHVNATDSALEQDEIDDLLSQWGEARRSDDGATGYVPPGLKAEVMGQVDTALYVEGRNQARVDIANLIGIPAMLLDGSVAQASLTYQTEAGSRNRFYDETVPLWCGPIEARLSMDDCVPRGTRVRFDWGQLTGPAPAPTGAPEED